MHSGSPPTIPDGARLSLTTLGGWSLAYSGPGATPGYALGSSKPLALVVYLALAPGRTVRREQVLDLLWADLEPTAAAHALRQTLWILRQRFGEHLVVSATGELRLAGVVDVDRDAFLAAVEVRDYERAVELYRGDFLPGFAAPGGAEFERWADIERDRLRDTFLRAGDALVRRLLDTSRFREAVTLARRVRDADPGHEGGWRLLIEALSSSGGALRAAVEADALDQMLRAEHREPEPATRIVLRLARQVSDAQAPAPPRDAGAEESRARGGAAGLVAELVGREREFSAVLRAWDATRGGNARHVHVTGAAGIGKTRLLADVHTRLRSTGARAVLLRPNPGERQVAYAFASDLASALSALPGAGAVSPAAAGALVALSPTLSTRFPAAAPDGASGEEALRRRTIALAELVTAVADEAPLALLVDDVHWADPASRQALGGVVTRLGEEPVLLVTTARPTPEGAIGNQATEHIVLDPFTPHEIAALVTSLGTLPAEPWAADFAVRLELASHGSPLLVLETLQLLLERGLLQLGDDGWHCSDPEAVAAALGEGRALRQRLQQLDREQRWLLLALAVLGSPVTAAQLAAHLPRGEAALAADLAALEQRGFLARTGDQWTPAHDEIAQAAIEMASPETLRAAHLDVGRAAALEAGRDESLLVRAGQHLAQAGDDGELGRVFTRWFIHQRQRGDRRRAAALAAELLGASATESDVGRLVGRLPRTARWGLYSRPRRAAAAAVVLVAVAAAGFALRSRSFGTPDEELIAITRAAGGAEFRALRVPLRADRWDETRPLDAAVAGRPYSTIRAPADWETSAVYSAARDAWVVSRVMPDPYVQDLFLIHADGSEIRLTRSPGDDVDPTWAPDGSAIAFCSARWSAQSWYHIGILDPSTLTVRRLTFGDVADHSPRWSIDGTRIAFVRQYRGQRAAARPLELCWVSVDGAQGHCTEVEKGYGFSGLSKWLNAEHVGAVVDSAGESSYASVDIETGDVTIIRRNMISAGTSPDGLWALGIVGEAEDASGTWVVFPVARADRGVEVRLAGKANNFVLRWGRSSHDLPFVTGLAVAAPGGPVSLGTAYRLRARGITTAGDTVVLPKMRWWSGDTATASVSADGEIVGRRHGELWVHVTAGGWRSDSLRVTVRSPAPTVVLHEGWEGRWRSAWVPYGVPAPSITSGPEGVRAMWNRGDGSFASGAYSIGSYSGVDGVGAEVRLSSPITTVQWQTLVVQLDADFDEDALARWDHRTGPIPRRPVVGGNTAGCAVGVPGGEGAEYADQLSFGAGQSIGHAALPAGHSGGRWYRLRVQIFADGRCGVALDGRRLWISRRPVTMDRPFRVVLSGNSVGTRMLVGPVDVWQGEKSGVDWARGASGIRVKAAGHPRSAPNRRLAP